MPPPNMAMCPSQDMHMMLMFIMSECAFNRIRKPPLSCMNCNLQFEFKNQTSKKAIITDMCHRIPYMYIKFQQNQVSRSLKTVHTNIFANNRKLQNLRMIIMIHSKKNLSGT